MFRSCVFWNYHSYFDKNINSFPGYIVSVCSSKKIRWMTGFAFLVGLAGSTITVLCSGGKSRTDKIKIEVYGYRKTGNSIKISFNFNHLILYRISVWLVSLVFFFLKKNQFLEDMTSLSLSLQQSTIEIMAECPIKNSRLSKFWELPVSSHLKIDTNIFLKDKESTDVMSLLLFKSWKSLKIAIGNQ